jgi:hypothetical protein
VNEGAGSKSDQRSVTAEIYELVSHFDLSLNNLSDLLNWEPHIVEDLHTALWERIYAAQYSGPPPPDAIDQFCFLASASIRGDVCPGCRREKIDSLGRFTALYSDETIVPLPLGRPGRGDDLDDLRQDIIRTIESLLRLRPLIEQGIAKPAVMTTVANCEHELTQTRELIDIAIRYSDQLADLSVDQFPMFYEPNTEGGNSPKLYIHGPKQYIEHGEIVLQLPERPSWVAKSWRAGSDGLVVVPQRTARKVGFVHSLFRRIASDTTFYLAYGIPRRSKLLTDLPGDTELLRGIDQEELEVQKQRAILLNALGHALPFTNELSLAETIKLRNELKGAFEQYRFAITSVVRAHQNDKSLSPKIAKQIFQDELIPKITVLENQIEAERKRMRVRTLSTTGVISVVVGLGLFGFVSPASALSMLGGAATMKLADHLSESATLSPQVATNDLYFLLKLKQSSRRK